MPIITPAFPSMCATHNISLSTKAVILRELQRGGDIVDRIFLKQLTWNHLFARHTFFTRDYKYYLCITASGTTKEAQSVWSGFVESKVRHLVGALDRKDKDTIAVAHPFPAGFERVHVVHDDRQAAAAKSGSIEYKVQDPPKTPEESKEAADNSKPEQATNEGAAQPNENTANEAQTLYTTSYYIGLELRPLEPGMITTPYPSLS